MKYKHLIITGATGGLGKSLSKTLLNEKNNIICHLVGRNETELTNLSVERKSYIYIYDFSSTEYIDKLCEEVFSNIDKGSLDKIIFINCAGTISPICKIEELTNDDIRKSISINLEWPINIISKLTKLSADFDIDVDIINITSGTAKKPLKAWSMYSVTKSAMITFLNTLCKEYSNIRIVNLDPGVMDTKMQEYIRLNKNSGFENIETFIKYKENNILRDPKEVAKKIKYAYIDNWLCTNEYEHIKKYD